MAAEAAGSRIVGIRPARGHALIAVNAARRHVNTMDRISVTDDDHEQDHSRISRARALRCGVLRADSAGTCAACAPCPSPGFPRPGLSSLRTEGARALARRPLGAGLAWRTLRVVVDRRRLLVFLSGTHVSVSDVHPARGHHAAAAAHAQPASTGTHVVLLQRPARILSVCRVVQWRLDRGSVEPGPGAAMIEATLVRIEAAGHRPHDCAHATREAHDERILAGC